MPEESGAVNATAANLLSNYHYGQIVTAGDTRPTSSYWLLVARAREEADGMGGIVTDGVAPGGSGG